MELSPEQVRQKKQVMEYTELVTNPTNHIGLIGNQPTLTRIRTAFHNKEITSQELTLVLTKLAQDLDGQDEPFKDHKAVYKYMFGNTKPKAKLTPTVLSAAEQAAIIQGIMPEKKKSYSGPRKKAAPKPEDKINKSALPAHLQYLV